MACIPFHVSVMVVSKGSINTLCAGVTENNVIIPTIFSKGRLEIKIWGEVRLEMSFKTQAGSSRYDLFSAYIALRPHIFVA